MFKQSAPMFKQSAPMFKQSAPMFKQSAPMFKQSAPMFKQYQKTMLITEFTPIRSGKGGHKAKPSII
jgi:hypothetical protein